MATDTTATQQRMLLGGAVRRLREAKRIKLGELATAAQIKSEGYLSRVERNVQQPSVEVMCRLANALGVDLDDISYMATIYVVSEQVPA